MESVISSVAPFLWCGGLAFLLDWTLRARRATDGPISRRHAAAAVVLVAVVAATAPVLLVAAAAGGGPRESALARARLSLHAVDLPLPDTDRPMAIGWAPDSTLRMPAAIELDEARRGWDILHATAADGAIILSRAAPPEPTTTRLLIERGDDVIAADPAAWASALARRCASGGSRASRDLRVPTGAAALALLCRGATPVHALVVQPERARLRVVPLDRRGGRFAAPHTEVGPDALVQIGSTTEAAPGVAVWEVPSPPGATSLLVPPSDPHATCGEWHRAVAATAPQAAAARNTSVCVLPYVAPYALEVRRLVADTGGLLLRASWAAALLALPALAWLLWLAADRRSRLTRDRLAAALTTSWVSLVLVGIACVRLLWAHRIDMLRDFEAAGWRTDANVWWIALIAAALAATAADRAATALLPRQRLALAAGAWFLSIVFGALAAGGLPGGTAVATAALSFGLGAGPALLRTAGSITQDRPVVILLGLAVATAIVPPLPAFKLALAWGIVLAFHAAFSRSPRAALLGGGAAACGALALDAGLTAALVAPGMIVGAIFAAHAEAADPAVRLARAVLCAAAAALVTAAALAAPADEMGRAVTDAAMHLPLLAAALLVAPAASLWHQRGRAAWPWAAAALALALGWLVRAPLLDAVMAGDTQAARRIAQVADPGHALLDSPPDFLASFTAWRESALPADVSPWTGEGLFGAQLIDPGVLLSVDNDYLAVIAVRETGVAGILAIALLLGIAAAGLLMLAAPRLGAGTPRARRRALVSLVLGGLIVYQPLGALGVLPLTGLPWPGLGIDSRADLFLFAALLLWSAIWSSRDQALPEPAPPHARGLVRAERAAAALAAAGLLLLLGKSAHHAATRTGDLRGIAAAVAYARGLACDGTPGAPPDRITGRPVDPTTERFHHGLAARWDAARPAATAALAACTPTDEECVARVRLGLPEVVLTRERGDDGAPHTRCTVEVPDDTLRRLRLPRQRPLRGARVRLVSRAMGAASRDVGELVSGALVLRLRPGAGDLDLTALTGEPAGLHAAARVQLAAGVAVLATDDGARLEVDAAAATGAMLLERTSLATAGDDDDAAPDATGATWRRVPLGADPTPLDRLALVVAGGRAPRGVWLFRARSRWPLDPDGTAVVDPLLADDVGASGGAPRRAYVYGGLLPELGWVNRYRARASLGLDGWVRVALDEMAASRGPLPPTPSCVAFDPPVSDPRQVCAVAADGAVECRVAIQPELALRLRHLTEMAALAPNTHTGRDGYQPALRASFALLRGDTGEIVSQGEFVPGRQSSLYAPATAAIEQQLLRAREDRDPTTGKTLPPALRGEASGEKAEWNQPIAVGSALKPLLARAVQHTDPDRAAVLFLRGSPHAGAACRGNRAHAVLGHCPPTDSLWNHRQEMGPVDFLAQSANWYLAALGLAGTALPDGRAGFGAAEVSLDEVALRDVGDHPTAGALWTERDGRRVIGADHTVDLEALRDTPMWRHFEALWGRPLCLGGDKAACRKAVTRGDLCAARALPIAEPTADLRHLVALGPGAFDFYPETPPPRPSQRVATLEYLQFLRGSGVHPLGSLLQMTDAFNRVVFDPVPGRHGYHLAASWFPVAAAGGAPSSDCRSAPVTGDPVRDGLCEVIRSGTARRGLGPLLEDPGVVLYGAKTGTIDSLADVAERPRACERFRQAHTVTDRARTAKDQPYWLPCGAAAKDATLDDSLLLVSFGVATEEGTVPFTLGLRFQRTGGGFASEIARHYIAAVRDYFAPPAARLP